MSRSNPRRSAFLPAVAALVAVVAVLAVAAGGFGRAPDQADPSAAPTSPGVSPSPAGSPTGAPIDHPPIDGDVIVDLANTPGTHVTAAVRDTSGDVIAVRSGVPGDGMSVGWRDLSVAQVDAHTISLTWVGLAIDDQVHIEISPDGEGYLIEIVQAGPVADSDATGYDRVLIVTFDAAVDAGDVTGGVAERSAN